MSQPSVSVSSLCTKGDMANNWRKFKRNYEAFIRAYYDRASDEKKIAILLHAGGDIVNDAFDSFYLTKSERRNLRKVIAAFDNYFLPSTTHERHLFFSRKQLPGESYQDFLASLQVLSNSCDFGNLKESLVKDMFIYGVSENSVRDVLLRTTTTDIYSVLEICRTMEVIHQQIRHFKKRGSKTKWLKCLKKETHASRTQLLTGKHVCPFRVCPHFRSFKRVKSKRSPCTVTFENDPELISFTCSGQEDTPPIPVFRTTAYRQSHNSTDVSISSYENLKIFEDRCGPSKVMTTEALVHRQDEPGETHSVTSLVDTDGEVRDSIVDQLRDDIDCAIMNGSLSNYPIISELLFDPHELKARLRLLEQGYEADVESSGDGLMKGSVTSENKAERPKTLRKLRNVYENAKMSGELEDAQDDGKLPEKGVLSPFDEQEEWAKISEIMASFGNLVRESVFITELEKEFQERLGLNLSDSSTSVGVGSSTVGTWLNSINMSQYEPIFINFGYDNLDFINGILDDNDLKEMGISEVDRKTILESSKSLSNKVAKTRNETVNNNNNEEKSKESVEDWLERLDLSNYWDTFRKHLYTDMDRVKSVWEVELTAVLEISKPGHRHRIMASLPRSPNQPSIQDINAELSQLKNSMQELEGKVVSSNTNTGTGTLRHSHKKTRPAPPPPGKPQPDLQIRDPSQLLVGVPSTITAQWRHQPHALLTGTLTYHARYLGSTVVKVLRGAESTKKSIQKLKKPLSEQSSSPDIYLAISYHGVKFLSGDTKELVCEHEIRNIHLACQDAEDLTHFAYITKDRATKSHYCHVFSVQTMDQATEVILTLGQAFEVAYQMALREANNSKGNGHTRSYSANLAPITTQPNHNRSHSVNEIKLNGESISNGHTSTPPVLMSEDV